MKQGRDRIVLIGAAVLDVLVRPASPEIFRTGSSPAEDIRMGTGGDALNEAVVLAGLGKKAELRTVIGRDMAGEMILRECRTRGILCDRIEVREDLATGINVVLVQENGERNFFTNPGGSLRNLSFEDVSAPLEDDTGILCLASIFVSPLLGPAEMEKLFLCARNRGITVCADMTKRKNKETVETVAGALRYVDYLIPNREEAMLLTGADSPGRAADILLEAGVGNVAIKCGAEGCLIKNRQMERMVPAMAGLNCVDTTGAGDSFAGGFLAALSEGRGFEECARFANKCGAAAVQVVGATKWIDNLSSAGLK